MNLRAWRLLFFSLGAAVVLLVVIGIQISAGHVTAAQERYVVASALVARGNQRVAAALRRIAGQLDRVEVALKIEGAQPALPGAPKCVVLRSVGKRLCYHDLVVKPMPGSVR